MACGSNSDETEIVKVLKEMSVENQMTHKGVLPRNPSSAAKPLGSDVSLVRGVVVLIIAFTFLVLFRSLILFLHVVSERKIR